LEEGTQKFTLRDGRTFTIYASPYTPEFNGYGVQEVVWKPEGMGMELEAASRDSAEP